MGQKHFRIQLHDLVDGSVIQDSGGVCYVAKANDAQKETLYTKAGAAQTNPVSLTNGLIEFYTGDTVDSVDLYIMAPGGQFVIRKGVKASGPNELMIDKNARDQVAVIPFAIADTAAATETDTGFDMPQCVVKPHPAVKVLTADAGITIEAGLKSSESGGDLDGFIDAVSVATATLVKATIGNSGNTLGALFEVQDSINAGDLTHEGHVVTGAAAVSVTYTLLAGADTAEGFIVLPYQLAA